ncbi:hypothetical protein [Candidatus Entotheonella palauensis]|uniref:Uncharacterized protein n=1 Tax=Candidatus Entotheonella gemina TaxID=1429439 RepID=W4LHE7_9BACT|nr:hypothetical protein [Candidatus Entotheonella palauensis]ETW97319.1 MAG: hypothetical protein ETSY2_44825 [Candidatus Entotheonella gemina]
MSKKAWMVFMGAFFVIFGIGLFNSAPLFAQASCPDPNDPNVGYVSQDPQVCAVVRFTCSGGQTPFSNQCGCGCIGEREACPDPKDPKVEYVSQDPSVCARIRFTCDAGSTGFSNHCGCGCIASDKQAKCALPPSGVCTDDINPCGNASACECPTGYSYDPAAGQCLLNLANIAESAEDKSAQKKTVSSSKCVLEPTGICTDDINQCGNSSVCQCPKGTHYNAALGACLRDLR